jgi:tetratricopeptide (TPR) repeat protein
LKKDNPEALNGIGLILLQRKNPRDAYRLFVEANKYDADYPPAILNMAVVAHQHLDALSTARAKYREYLTKAPGAPHAGEVEAAIRQLDSILNPSSQPSERVQLASVDSSPPPVVVVTNTPRITPGDTEVAKATNPGAEAKPAATPPPPPARTNPVTTAAATPPRATTTTATNSSPETAATVRTTPPTTNKPVQVASATSVPRTNRVQPPAAPPKAPERNESTTLAPALTTPSASSRETPASPIESTAPPAGDEPPLEVVAITETPVVPATEILPAGDIQPAATSTPEPPVAAATARTSDVLPRLEEPKSTREKRGFFQRINPVNLFRSDKGDEPGREEATDAVRQTERDIAPVSQSTPAATSGREAVARPAELARRDDVTQLPEPLPARRYSYGRIKKPEPKDRAAAERLFERGVDATTRRDPGGAASFFQAAVEADPTYFAAHYNLGLVAFSTGQSQRALSAFETALVLDPNSAEARYNFALTLQKNGYAVDAARELEQVLERKPDETRAMLLLGNVYAQALGRISDARRMYQQVLEREPRHPQATAIRYWLSENP